MKLLLAARANLLHQERALGAVNIVRVTVVLDGGMATGRAPLAIEAAVRGQGATGLRWLEDRPSAVAADLFEDSFRTSGAGSAMANLLTEVAAAFELPAAGPDADMLCLNRRELPRDPVLPLCCLSLCRLFLASAAALKALVSPTAQVDLADSQAQRMLHVSLVTYRSRGRATAPA
jgi:hypothetical protein